VTHFVEIRKEVEAGPSKMGSYGVHGNAQRESLRLEEEAKAYAQAAKANNAEVPTHLWNDRIVMPKITKERWDRALAGLRKLGFRRYQRILVKDWVAFVRKRHGEHWKEGARRQGGKGPLTELGKDLRAIAGVLWHIGHASWFKFDAGSRLVHFRFPERYQREARDGVRVYFKRPGPTTRRAQPVIDDTELRARTREKVGKVMRRRYLLPTGTPGTSVKSYIKYFAVPKGVDNIRMVYDATANKLNKAVWVPTFWLPTIDMLVRNVGRDSWMMDRDIRDMFLNFQLHDKVRPYTAVDLTCLQDSPAEGGLSGQFGIGI
jgi:hypothetical protein